MKRIIWIMLCAFCVSRGALAALGEIRAAALSPGKNYSVVETEVGLIKIREYVSESGSVFAVAWNGQSHPDFKNILGGYFAEYKQAEAQSVRVHGQRFRSVKSGRIILEKSGRMRNVHGRAYVASLMPAGVSPDEIK